MIRVFNLAKFDFIKDLFKKTGFDKILLAIAAVIFIFWLLFYLFSPSYGGFDDFYFIIVTLTTVGYGDVTPRTYNEKVLVILLILIGIFIFSAITAAMSSFLTDRILNEDEEDIIGEVNSRIDEQSELIRNELNAVHEENERLHGENARLHEEIEELKELIRNK